MPSLSPYSTYSRVRIVEILTPEQKTQFDSLLAAERQKRSDAEIDRTVGAYQKILTLTDDQAKALRAALAEARARRHEMYKPGGDWRANRKELRDQQNKAIEKAFTAEQFKRYLEISELER